MTMFLSIIIVTLLAMLCFSEYYYKKLDELFNILVSKHTDLIDDYNDIVEKYNKLK